MSLRDPESHELTSTLPFRRLYRTCDLFAAREQVGDGAKVWSEFSVHVVPRVATHGGGSAQLAATLKADTLKWGKVIKDAKIRLE